MQATDLFNKKIALLLDFDGTLADLADDPTQVTVDPCVRESLKRIVQEKKTPVAIITGRQISVLDRFLQLPQLPVSGNHGTEIRLPGSSAVTHYAPPIPVMMWRSIEAICKTFDCFLEDKIETAAIHASNQAAFYAAKNDISALLSEAGKDYSLWPVNLSLEIHHASYSKVTGIREMVGSDLFKKSKAVYIGDDVRIYPGMEVLDTDKLSLIHVGTQKGSGFHSAAEVKEFLVQFSGYS